MRGVTRLRIGLLPAEGIGSIAGHRWRRRLIGNGHVVLQGWLSRAVLVAIWVCQGDPPCALRRQRRKRRATRVIVGQILGVRTQVWTSRREHVPFRGLTGRCTQAWVSRLGSITGQVIAGRRVSGIPSAVTNPTANTPAVTPKANGAPTESAIAPATSGPITAPMSPDI